MATVRETAEALGVTRQRVQQIIGQLPKGKRPQKRNGAYVITDKSLHEIASRTAKTIASIPSKPNDINELKTKIADKQNQIDKQDKAIADYQATIQSLTKLLDQAQRLQLVAENKVKQLESPENDSQISEAKNEPVTPSNDIHDEVDLNEPEMPRRAKMSLWRRIFNRR